MRAEMTEVLGLRSTAKTAVERYPHLQAEVLPVGSGVAAFLGEGSPLSEATGIGIEEPLDGSEIERVTRFYAERGVPAKIVTSPLADVALLRALIAGGYHPVEHENLLVGDLSNMHGKRHEAVRVASDPERWGDVSARGFLDGAEPTEAFRLIGVLIAMTAHVTALEAVANGEVVATGCLDRDGDMAGFFATSTLPAFRGQGWQTALIEDRVARARESGARYGRVTAVPGGKSERRLRAAGFVPLYTRVIWERK